MSNKWVKEYDKRTYKAYTINFRQADDADLIEDFEKLRELGYNNREAIRVFYEAWKSLENSK